MKYLKRVFAVDLTSLVLAEAGANTSTRVHPLFLETSPPYSANSDRSSGVSVVGGVAGVGGVGGSQEKLVPLVVVKCIEQI